MIVLCPSSGPKTSIQKAIKLLTFFFNSGPASYIYIQVTQACLFAGTIALLRNLLPHGRIVLLKIGFAKHLGARILNPKPGTLNPES